MTVAKKNIGSRNELIACAWLLNQGYEVFRNVSTHGAIDVIAVKKQHVLLLDVKGRAPLKRGGAPSIRLTEFQKKKGIQILHVLSDTECLLEERKDTMIGGHIRDCAHCSTPFLGKKGRHIFCSPRCAKAAKSPTKWAQKP